jgi:guanylate kinase
VKTFLLFGIYFGYLLGKKGMNLSCIHPIINNMIILTGPSASGKTEIAKILFQKYGIQKVITHTTRPMRPTETKDVDYHFVDETTFINMMNQAAFIETTIYNGFRYGTSKAEVGDQKVLIVDTNGLKAFTALANPRFVTFFIQASEITRLNRMIIRGQDLAFAKSRLQFDEKNFNRSHIQKIDYDIDNERVTIEDASDRIYHLYQQHLSKKKT